MTFFTGLIIVAALIALYIISLYNRLVRLRIAVDNAWSQITVQLKRRHDLIPNLVETVRGYAIHEKETLTQVIEKRNAAVTAGQSGNIQELGQAETALSGMLRQIFALAESYPDLKANQNFMQLSSEISSTENSIGFARSSFNESVASYNTSIEQFPGNIIAGMYGFNRKDFFELGSEEISSINEVPKVKF